MRLRFIGYFLGLLFINCTKITNSNPYAGDNSNIVVEGGVNGLVKIHAIRITQVSTSTLTDPVPVTGLRVQVKGGGDVLNFTESTEKGIYTCVLDHKLKVNQRYSFSAISPYNAMQIFALDTLYKVSPILGSQIPFTTTELKTGKIEIQIPKHIFGQKYCSKWLVVSKSDSLWDPVQFKTNYAFTHVHKLGIPNVLYSLYSVFNTKDFNPADSVRIYKFSVSSTHGVYLYGIFEETEWKGLFSGAPSQVIGNINLNGQGFFSALDVDSRTYRVKDLLGKKQFF